MERSRVATAAAHYLLLQQSSDVKDPFADIATTIAMEGNVLAGVAPAYAKTFYGLLVQYDLCTKAETNAAH